MGDGREQRTFSGSGRLEGERKARETMQGRENVWGQGYRIFSLRTALVGNIKVELREVGDMKGRYTGELCIVGGKDNVREIYNCSSAAL